MNLKDAREAYYEYSRTLSSINRQLTLSGIAIIWFFAHPEKNQTLNFGIFKYSFIAFCFALFFDLCHYALATIIWGSYHHYKEKKISRKREFTAPECINWISIIMMTLKVTSAIVAYILLLNALF